MNKQNGVSAIVPLYNESKRVTSVVEILLNSPIITEVICVNDGSTDNSLIKLEKFKGQITLINLLKNHGKGYAMAAGVKKAKHNVVAFFDADLVNFRNEHIETLLGSIVKNKTRAVLGYPTGRILPGLFKDVTGERAYFRTDLLPHLEKLEKTTRFSAEYLLNSLFEKKEIERVALKGLTHLYRHEKYRANRAVKEVAKDIVVITRKLLK